jgi:hypothetical protein
MMIRVTNIDVYSCTTYVNNGVQLFVNNNNSGTG